MKVTELTRAQLIQLKQEYICEALGETSWGALANADSLVPDEDVIDYYQGIDFVEEDF